MAKHRKEIALQVARSLYASEDAIDAALSQVARFVAEMPAARQEAKFAACVGQDALAQAIAAMTALSEAREAMVIAIAFEGDDSIAKYADHVIFIPRTDKYLAPLLAVLPLQLLAYYAALTRGCDVDKPRNLAKSVTVE